MNELFVWVLGGGLIGIVGFIMTNNQVQDKKIERSYERLDETKTYQDATFTRKDVCMILHNQITSSLDEIKGDIKVILKNCKEKD